MKRKTFLRFRDLVHEHSGIWLRDGKEALVCARVGKRLRALGLGSYEDYLDLVASDESGRELSELLNAISTNVTRFFREEKHFRFLREQLESWLREGQRQFRFWCAACATGEEPYSLAIALLESTRLCDVDLRILATDISASALRESMIGLYSESKMEHVPSQWRSRYFNRERSGDGTVLYRVKDRLKETVVFRRLNLSQPPFPVKGPLDAVLCRNVMMYFDQPVRQRLLTELFRVVRWDGYLLVGHAESLAGTNSDFRTVCPSIYVKPGSANAVTRRRLAVSAA